MTPLRQRMIKAMELMNFSKHTQRFYLSAVTGLVRYYQDIYNLFRNAFQASFINPIEKQKHLDELDEFVFGFSVH